MASTSPTSSPVTSRLPGVSSLRRSGEINLDSDSEEATERLVSKVRDRVLVKPVEQEQPVDRVKATRSYSIFSTVKYGFFLPLKKKTVGLEKDQENRLNNYNQHRELCSGIDKVQKAYTQYKAAREGVEGAKGDDKYALAQFEEHNQKVNLSSRYDELLELAANQAGGLGVSEAGFKADVHVALSRKEKGLIFSTIQMVRAELGVVDSLDDDADDARVDFRAKYVDFVFGTVRHVRQAMENAGTNERAAFDVIIQSMIDGLSSISNFESSDSEQDDIQIIKCHGQLVLLQEGKSPAVRNELEQRLVGYFNEQLKDLMNSKAPITRAHLEEIQCNGISLLSVIELSNNDIKVLNELKRLKNQHQVLAEKIALNAAAFAKNEKVVTQVHACPVSQVAEFLSAVEVAGNFERTNANKFATAPKDHVLQTGAEFKRYRQAAAELAQVQARITALDVDPIKALEAGIAENIDLPGERTRLTQVIEDLKGQIVADNREVTRLGTVKDQYHRASLKHQQDILKDVDKDDEGTRLYKEDTARDLKTNSDAKELSMQANIADLCRTVAGKQLSQQNNEEALRAVELRIAKLRLAELNNTVINLTGDDLRQLADYMGITRATKTINDNIVYENYETARSAHQRCVEFTSAGRDLSSLASDNAAQMTAQANLLKRIPLAFTFNPDNHSFDVAVQSTDAVQESLAIEIDANLEIALEMTMRVHQALDAKGREKMEDGLKEVTHAATRRAILQQAAFSKKAYEDQRAIHLEQDLNGMIARRIGIDLIEGSASPAELVVVRVPAAVATAAPVLSVVNAASSGSGSPIDPVAAGIPAAVATAAPVLSVVNAASSGSGSLIDPVVAGIPAATVASAERLVVLPVDDLPVDDTPVSVDGSSKSEQPIVTPEREIINTL